MSVTWNNIDPCRVHIHDHAERGTNCWDPVDYRDVDEAGIGHFAVDCRVDKTPKAGCKLRQVSGIISCTLSVAAYQSASDVNADTARMSTERDVR